MDIKNQLDDLYCALNIKRYLVGVKFIFSYEEFNSIDIEPMKSKVSYCYMVKSASSGRHIKASLENFACRGATKALGLEEPNSSVISGQNYYSFKLYNSLGTAKAVQKNVTFINHKIYGVVIKPLHDYDVEPDVVIIILNAYQAMRIIQGYTYHFGVHKNIKMAGNQGICSECTATPYETNDLNISVLCSNTRLLAKWDEGELGIGMPFNKFGSVVDGVMKTLNPVEPDYKKREIIERAREKGRFLDVELGKNYYTVSHSDA